MDLTALETTKLFRSMDLLSKNLKARGVIRTNNLLGDLGEYLAIECYNHTAGLPLWLPPLSAQKTLMLSAAKEIDTASNPQAVITQGYFMA